MIWVWLACILVASFLSWGTIAPTSFSGFPGGLLGGLTDGFFGGISISVNAWSGNVTLMGLQLPNWLPIVAAVGATGAAYARSTGTQLPAILPLALLIYALIHVALFGFIVLGSGRGSLGIGTIAMFFALAALLFAVKSAPNAGDAPDIKAPII